MFSPRLFHRGLDVSMFLVLVLSLQKQTSVTQEGSTLPTAALVTAGKMVALLVVYMALTTFAMLTPVAKTVQVSVCWCRQSHA